MATAMNFRTAFNGFNREDVVRYIEYLNSKHTAEISQLNSELDYLREKAEQQTPEQLPESSEPDPVIEQQAARIRELFDQCKEQEQELAVLRAGKAELHVENNQLAELQAAKEQLAQLQAENERLIAQLAIAAQQQTLSLSRKDEELAAYRRAERTERIAKERAEQMYRQANGALADAAVKVEDAANQIGELTDRVSAQLIQLQAAVAGSKTALKDAAATMYIIRPETEE